MPARFHRAGPGFYLLPVLMTLLGMSGCASLPGGRAGDTLALEQVSPSVARHYVTVAIREPAEPDGSRSRGAVRKAGGVLLGRGGLVVTAAHVARTMDNQSTVITHEGRRYPAVILHVSPTRELAILRADLPPGSEPPPPAINRNPRAGDAVIGIGLPTSREVSARTGTVRVPRQAGAYRFGKFGFHDPLVANLRIESGFSGGPVFDDQQRWLGMIVGYDLARSESGEFETVEKAYVLPAADILAYVEGFND